MHIFLTGQVQIGKSTALRRFFAGYPGVPGGFCTCWRGDVLLFRLRDEQAKPLVLARRGVNGLWPYKAAFDAAGKMLLAADFSQCDLLCFDELGYMEQCSAVFQQAVIARLDGTVPIVGVLRRQPNGPFWETLHRRNDTQIWTVTKENREDIPLQLAVQYRP